MSASKLHKSEQIAAAKFKARCLELLDHVQQARRTIIVTKHGKPVARLVPYEDDSPPILSPGVRSIRSSGGTGVESFSSQ